MMTRAGSIAVHEGIIKQTQQNKVIMIKVANSKLYTIRIT